jgi:hypothetical protein
MLVVVRATNANILLMLYRSQNNVSYDEEIAGALYFPDLRLTILALKILKRERFVQTNLTVASYIFTIYLIMILTMNRMDSVEGQASRSDERYLCVKMCMLHS